MVDPIPVALGLGALVVALWYGVRTHSSLQEYRALGEDDPLDATVPVNGETITIEGTLEANGRAPASEHVERLFDEERALALVDWRVQAPQGKNRYRIDIENRTITRKRTTVEAGVEAVPFTLEDGTREYRIDPQWLVEAADGPALGSIDRLGASSSSPLFGSDWGTGQLYLSEHTVERPLQEVEIFAEAANDPQTGRYRFGARVVPAGETIAVHGRVTIEDGVPVVRGTDETPLLVSDDGIGGLTAGVRNTLVKRSVAAGGALVIGTYLLYAGVWSVPL